MSGRAWPRRAPLLEGMLDRRACTRVERSSSPGMASAQATPFFERLGHDNRAGAEALICPLCPVVRQKIFRFLIW